MMTSADVVQVGAALILLGVVALAVLRGRAAPIEVVAFDVSTPQRIDQHVRAIGHLLNEAPDLRRLELNVGAAFVAAPASIRALSELQTRLSRRRISLSITAPAAVALTLRAHGVAASARMPPLHRSVG
jgi:hypothetical protein